MPITQEQLANRNSYVGASEVAAIMGLSRYRTAWDVWAEKTGYVEPAEAGEAAELGIALEPAIIKLAEQELGEMDCTNLELPIPDTPIVAHLDARLKATGEPVEIKTTGLLGGRDVEWQEGSVPYEYVVQVMIQAKAAGTKTGRIAALVVGKGMVYHTISVDDDLVAEAIERVKEFWKYVESKEPPPVEPSLEMVRRIPREDTAIKVTPDQASVYEEYLALREQFHTLEKELEARKAAVLLAMGRNRRAILPNGVVFTVTQQRRQSFDAKQFQKEYADLYRQYCKETTIEVLTVREAKHGD